MLSRELELGAPPGIELERTPVLKDPRSLAGLINNIFEQDAPFEFDPLLMNSITYQVLSFLGMPKELIKRRIKISILHDRKLSDLNGVDCGAAVVNGWLTFERNHRHYKSTHLTNQQRWARLISSVIHESAHHSRLPRSKFQKENYGFLAVYKARRRGFGGPQTKIKSACELIYPNFTATGIISLPEETFAFTAESVFIDQVLMQAGLKPEIAHAVNKNIYNRNQASHAIAKFPSVYKPSPGQNVEHRLIAQSLPFAAFAQNHFCSQLWQHYLAFGDSLMRNTGNTNGLTPQDAASLGVVAFAGAVLVRPLENGDRNAWTNFLHELYNSQLSPALIVDNGQRFANIIGNNYTHY